MLCLASLLRDHKGEVEDILVADKQVGAGREGSRVGGRVGWWEGGRVVNTSPN